MNEQITKILAEIEKLRIAEVDRMEKQGYTDYHSGLRDGYNNVFELIVSLQK